MHALVLFAHGNKGGRNSVVAAQAAPSMAKDPCVRGLPIAGARQLQNAAFAIAVTRS